MPNYADTDDVNDRIVGYTGFQLGASTDPSTTEATEQIEEAEARLHATLRAAGYSTFPATNSTDIVLFRGMVANKVALWVLFQTLGFDAVPDSASDALSGWREFLKDIKDGLLVLEGETPAQNVPKIWRSKVHGSNQSEYIRRYNQH